MMSEQLWIRKRALMKGEDGNPAGKLDGNGELLTFTPAKVLGGYGGYPCKHITSDFKKIGEVIGTVKPTTIVELGTGGGGVTAFFAEISKQWGGEVHTFDIVHGCRDLADKYDNITFHLADAIKDEKPNSEIVDLIRREGVMLYCDNGKKEIEIRLYSGFLKGGSLIGVHDYDTEVNSFWIEDFLNRSGFDKFHHEELSKLQGTVRYELAPGYQDGKGRHIVDGGSLTRLWIKRIMIFVDVDETICFYDNENERFGYKNPIPNYDNIKKINELYYKVGNYVKYWTSRGSFSGIDYYDLTRSQLDSWGCKYHELSVGEKPSYDLLICDRSKRIEDI